MGNWKVGPVFRIARPASRLAPFWPHPDKGVGSLSSRGQGSGAMTGPAGLSSLGNRGVLEPFMPSNDDPADAGPAQVTSLGLVAVTVDLTNGRVVRVEGVDDAGERHDLTDEERAGLADTAA